MRSQSADWLWQSATYPYNKGGNILTASRNDETHTYTYGDADWADLLTAYDGQAITYDAISNPLTDGTWNYTWKHGRQLASMTDGASTWTYSYNVDGLRTSRTNGTTAYNYIYSGSQLAQMTVDGNTLYFTYDASGTPQTVTYNGTTYYYATNIQGDVVAILDSTGTAVVTYTYDAWGNHTSGTNGTGSDASTLGRYNPLRYRGYVFDTETELYYLQSRYYDPVVGRFINLDTYITTHIGNLCNNLFTYCTNNPVNLFDETGEFPQVIIDRIIHNYVLSLICSQNSNLKMDETCIYYNGKNHKDGLGYCDLYNKATGEVWELKKASKSVTCTTQFAQFQLQRYVHGRLKHKLGLELRVADTTQIEGGEFSIPLFGYIYIGKYYSEGNGILRYEYTKYELPKRRSKAVEWETVAVFVIVLGAVVIVAPEYGIGAVVALA